MLTMNARELMHFFALRCCNRAQWEIQELAWRMLSVVFGVAPALFGNAGPACIRGACSEGKMTCGKAAQIKKRHDMIVKGGR
jgi:thymidylate synthase (FAD)